MFNENSCYQFILGSHRSSGVTSWAIDALTEQFGLASLEFLIHEGLLVINRQWGREEVSLSLYVTGTVLNLLSQMKALSLSEDEIRERIPGGESLSSSRLRAYLQVLRDFYASPSMVKA